MISFETLQECRDLNEMLPYILEVMYDDFITFIIESGCAALSEEELIEFEELDKMLRDAGSHDVDPIIVKVFNKLVDKAAWDPTTRHVYALATRLYASTEPEESADIIELDEFEEALRDSQGGNDIPPDEDDDEDDEHEDDEPLPSEVIEVLDEVALRALESGHAKAGQRFF